MMSRLRSAVLACALLWAGLAGLPTDARATAAPQDFITQMTQILAIDPARAGRLANDESRRLSSEPDARRDGRLAAAQWVLAQSQFRAGDADSAKSTLRNVIRMTPAGRAGARLRGQTYLLQGYIARAEGNFGAALQLYRQAQNAFIGAVDARGQALSLQALGALYADVGDGASAVRYLALAEDAYGGDDVFLLSLNNNFGVALQQSEQFAESERRFASALHIAETLGARAYTTQIRLNMAFSELSMSRFAEAGNSLAQIGDPNTLPNEAQRIEAIRLAALLDLNRHQIETAGQKINSVLRGIDPRTSSPVYRQAHFAAYQIYARMGLPAKALEQLEAVRRIDAASEQLLASNRAAVIAAQFQFAAQDMRIVNLKAEQLRKDVAFERTRSQFQQTVTVVVLFASLVALGLLSGMLIIANRARNRAREDSAALAVVNQHLERALAAKTEFLASTSHEIRTPLNGILGMTQIMLADRTLATTTRAQVELVHDAGTTMRALVDDILDVAKIEHGGFVITPRPTDVPALAKRVTRLFAAQAEASAITLTCMSDLPDGLASCDPDRLTQIMFNLVGNALKFTHSGSISVALSLAAEADTQRLVLTVTDTGIGIAPEWQDAVFDMFRQVDQGRTRSYGGTGLGLAICRQLARAMGGDIRVESAVGEGSTFIVHLPWEPISDGHNIVPIGASAMVDATPDDDRPLLVIAIDPMRSAMLATIARRAGCRVVLPEAIDELPSEDLPTACLIDGQAIAYAATCLAGYAGSIRTGIITGSAKTATEIDTLPIECVTFVPFARNCLTEALNESVMDREQDFENNRLRVASNLVNDQQRSLTATRRTAHMSRT